VDKLIVKYRTICQQTLSNPVVRDSVISLASNGLGRAGNLTASVVIAAEFGANHQTDIFYLIYGVLVFFLNLFHGTLELSFIPVYADLSRNNVSETNRFLGSIIVNLLVLGAVATFFIDFGVWALSHSLVGPSEKLIPLAVKLTWEMSPMIVISAISALFVALFNAERWFATAGAMPICQPAGIVICSYFWGSSWGIHALPTGLFAGGVFQVVTMYFLFTARKCKPVFTRYSPHLSKVFKASGPLLFGLCVFAVMPLIDRAIVSFLLPGGNVTALENATRLTQIPWSLATVGYINVFFSWWSSKGSEGESVFVISSFKKLFGLSVLVFVPVSLLLYWWATPLVMLVFGYVKYSETALVATAEVFSFLSLGYWAFMLRSTLVRYYSAQRNVSLIAKAAIWDFCVHIVVLLLFIERVGVLVVGLATSLGYLASLGCLVARYYRRG
jgi:putative peptidoglycan lipid II flippase